jgi:hypothetical protein
MLVAWHSDEVQTQLGESPGDARAAVPTSRVSRPVMLPTPRVPVRELAPTA